MIETCASVAGSGDLDIGGGVRLEDAPSTHPTPLLDSPVANCVDISISATIFLNIGLHCF